MNQKTLKLTVSFMPNGSDAEVIRLLDYMAAPFEPIELLIRPKKGAEISDCTNIIQEHIKEKGGKIVYGWQIWKSCITVEAEFHAVWENNKGDLVDLTPKPNGFTHILFAEDDRIIYEGKQIDTIRLNITNNVLVDHFIECLQALYRLNNTGERAFLYDKEFEDSLSDEEKTQIVSCNQLIGWLSLMIESGATQESVCFCGENVAYKDCHGKNFTEIINSLSPAIG